MFILHNMAMQEGTRIKLTATNQPQNAPNYSDTQAKHNVRSHFLQYSIKLRHKELNIEFIVLSQAAEQFIQHTT
jgi:hypothetical protein